jgi:hypothetical protein
VNGPGASLLVVLLVVVAVGATAWMSWTGRRLDRMHHRTDVSRATLDSHLLRRSGAALELAAGDALDPASRLLLLDAAHHARSADPDALEAAESALSQTLRGVLDDPGVVRDLRSDPGVAGLLDELAGGCAKVELARRFHNDVVVSARALRSRRRVRWLRLAGHALAPRTVDLDDVPPSGLVGGWSRSAGDPDGA